MVTVGMSQAGASEPRLALVVVDHGSSRDEANQWHEEFVRGWPDDSGYVAVEPAHMELAEPSVATAFDRCVAAGAELVVVAPYFLWPGRHWHDDIPQLVEAAAVRHAGVRYLVGAPLGPHPLLRDVVEDRVRRCLEHARGTAEACELCAGGEPCRVR